MWLVNTKTIRLESFVDEEHAPPYAILSHTWGSPENEVIFRDMDPRTTNQALTEQKLDGWYKIRQACEKARKYNYDYIWIDTCCIDKSSSAELQEAINSMYAYYKKSSVCFAYLSDVKAVDLDPEDDQEFRQARWFTRGWTLQELLAPRKVEFFNQSWVHINSKLDIHRIGKITGINPHWLFRDSDPRDANVAERMSWAGKRNTTRREDQAYCLLGLLGVYMPLLYGEGDRAFLRLQEEILKSNADPTIHLWGWPSDSRFDDYDLEIGRRHEAGWPGLIDAPIMAPHPNYFRAPIFDEDYEKIRPLPGFRQASFSMGQRGLTARLPLRADPNYEFLAYGILGFFGRNSPAIAIPLISDKAQYRRDKEFSTDEYWRPTWCRPIFIPLSFMKEASDEEILIKRPQSWSDTDTFEILPFRLCEPSTAKLKLIGTYPPSHVSGNFVSLSRPYLTHGMRNLDRASRDGRETFDTFTGRRLFLINASTSRGDVPLLLVVDYCMETMLYREFYANGGGRKPGCICSLDCRVFLVPKVHDLSRSMANLFDYTARQRLSQLEELPQVSHGGHGYYAIDDLETSLDVYVTPAFEPGELSSVNIQVTLVTDEIMTSARRRQSPSTSERQRWRFIYTPWNFNSLFDTVCLGSWADYIKEYPSNTRAYIGDLINNGRSPEIKKRVFSNEYYR